MRRPQSAGHPFGCPLAPSRARFAILDTLSLRVRGVVALALAVAFAACQEAPTAPDASDDVPPVEAFVSLVNSHRASLGCPALAWDGRVAEVAVAHSRDMAVRRFFSHTNPDGADPWKRLATAGVRYTTAGENIAYGQWSALAAFRSWMNSSGHRRNIENCAFTHHGVGLYDGRWTHVFIRPT